MIQTYTFAGTGRQIDAQGVFFRYESGADGSGVTAIRVLADGAILGTFEPGDTIDLPTPAKRWEIYPTSAGCIGSVRVGNARVTSSKLQGVVQVVDGAKARSISGIAFAAYAYQSPVAGQYAQVQLFNKTSSSRNFVLSEINMLSNSATGVYVTLVSTQLATLSGVGLSKKVYGSNSSAGELRTQTTGVGPVNNLSLRCVVVNTSGQSYRPIEPIVIPSGTGVTITAGNTGGDLGASFDWWEEAA